MIQFPLIHIVEIKIDGYGLNVFNLCCHKVNIVNRAKQNILQACIMGDQLHRRTAASGIDRKGTGQDGSIAILICHFKFDMMFAV